MQIVSLLNADTLFYSDDLETTSPKLVSYLGFTKIFRKYCDIDGK